MDRSYRWVSLLLLISILMLMWLIEFIDNQIPFPLDVFGIHPRSLFGLIGIPLMPFLHGDYAHLAGNTVGLILFSTSVIWKDRHEFWAIFLMVTILSGLGIWLLGESESIHIGASGIVYGFFGYLLSLAYFERSFASIVRACLLLFFFNGMLWIDTTEVGISWEAHLFGLLGGIWVGSESWG